MSRERDYEPSEALWLWWLGDPAAPMLIGELRIARALKGVSLIYGRDWLQKGFALSEDLPLDPGRSSLRKRRPRPARSMTRDPIDGVSA